VHFVNDGFEITYMAGPVLDRLLNRVRWQDGTGGERVGEIELNKPLILHGYRIYPTSNKGFAPLFVWHPANGAPALAAVHLPAYPGNALNQAQAWQPVGSKEEIWVMLNVAEDLIPADAASRFRLPASRGIVVRYRSSRWEMQPGERITLPDGTLEYCELRTWMGYRFYHDWTIPWLLAACAVGVVSMAWHFWRKFASIPWNKD
jgi:cytochrome c biogenesis protein ResB